MSLTGYFDSCSPYLNLVFKPGLPRLKLSEWPQQFSRWSATSVLVFFLVGIFSIIYTAKGDADTVRLLHHFARRLLWTFVITHLSWFVVVGQNGCIHPVISLIMGLCFITEGFCLAAPAWEGDFDKPAVFLSPLAGGMHLPHLFTKIACGLYGFCIFCMGISACMMFFVQSRTAFCRETEAEDDCVPYIQVDG
ncbi:unnamed protein product [Polarella glacialis]|uniref:Uncharacterized protein n=1 Tax=Polarella glacialis TaxID=89957 RepID=A0A813FMD4_POLGL|nr:unnamed protein product [Polarella glacialis]